MMACARCHTELSKSARFCSECGAPTSAAAKPAEYKQVTVLFADVVHSMDIAAQLDTERLREIMADLFERCSAVVQRYGGTVDKFTGDGIMALFGAPIALEDHAFRACLASLDIQNEITELAVKVGQRDGMTLRLRIGLNSGQVITGNIDSGPGGYTAIGVQVGMAQRMESVAPAGGVMISESTAHLVSHVAILGEPEQVSIKGSDSPVTAHRLLGTGDPGRRRHDTTLVGRTWELGALVGMLDAAVGGRGAIVRIVGSPGIGKSRIVSELSDRATHSGAEVFRTYCDAHAGDIPFHAVARLLRAVFGVDGVDPAVARDRLRARLFVDDADDLLLLDDLLGIADPASNPLVIDPDARRRRLTAMINTASLARTTPTVYVVEDAHWIDDISDSMLADFVAVLPQTPSLVIITQRPEYHGALAQLPRVQTIDLAPLDASQTASLAAELLGKDSSIDGLATQIAERAAGNPFFTEEIVRDLAERRVIDGRRGAYTAECDVTDVIVPSTLQATIAARIDRLDPIAKHTLNAAAAIGSRFRTDLVAKIVEQIELAALIDAELIDQVSFAPRAEYTFRHPLIRTVAYESQLRSTRADLHQRLATAIEQDEPESADENAALIAEHLQAAGELHAAFNWHMRAAAWSQYRSIRAAKTGWQRARDAADQLPVADPNRLAMRIAPRTLLCGNAWRIGGSVDGTGFDELRELTAAAGDKLSLAIGTVGLLTVLSFNDRVAEASEASTDAATLIESIGDPTLTVALLPGTVHVKTLAGEVSEARRLSQRIIDIADGDATMGNLVVGSPLAVALAYRGMTEMSLGIKGFEASLNQALAVCRPVDPTWYAASTMMKHNFLTFGASLADDAAVTLAAEAHALAERSGDDFALVSALIGHGTALVHNPGSDAEFGCELLSKAREMSLAQQYSLTGVQMADVNIAQWKLRTGDLDTAISLAKSVIDATFASGDKFWRAEPTAVLVESLLRRGSDADVAESSAAIERLAASPREPGFALYEIPLLRMRALLARAHGDEARYREFVGRYRESAAACGWAGHLAAADGMAAAV